MLGFQFELRDLMLLIASASASGASLLAGYYFFSCGFAVAVGVLVCVASWRDDRAASEAAAIPVTPVPTSPIGSR